MSEIRVDSLSNESNTGGPVLSGITEFSGQQYFIPPRGTTAERPSDSPPGSIRFNTDSAHLEYWNGSVWLEFEASSEHVGISTFTDGISARGTGTRGLLAGGYAPSPGDLLDRIEYITISTFGNSADFGNLVAPTRLAGACSSSTRGLFGGGASPAPTKTAKIDFITIASTGQTAGDFGDLITTRNQLAACSNQIRGIFSGGDAPSAITDVMEHVTIATTGICNDFGNLVTATEQPASCSSSVRGLVAGGSISGARTNVIQYVTISTTGNAQDFGDLTAAKTFFAGCSNSTRGLFGAGYIDGSNNKINSIDFITIATTGNAQDFGDLIVGRRAGQGACSSPTRGIFAGGQGGPSDAFLDNIDSVEFATTGNAADFGNLIGTTSQNFGCSNGHGGL